MALFAVLLVGWKEPEAFRKEQDRLAAAQFATLLPMRPYAMLLLAIFCLAARMISKHVRDETFDLVPSIVISLGSSWVLFYGLWWLVRRLPATVNLYSNGIMKMGQNRVRPFKSMTSYSWSPKDSYYVLRITTDRGRVQSYGVPDPVTRGKIDDVLRQNGLKESPR